MDTRRDNENDRTEETGTMATIKRQVECPCGGDYYEKTWDWSDDDKPVWHCANCGRQTKRIKKSRGKTMTPSQYDSVRQVVRSGFEKTVGIGEYEIKTMTAKREEHSGNIILTIEMGGKGDEGTMASIFCRYRMHVWIGRAGGLTVYVDGEKKVTGWKALIYGWQSR